MLTQEKLAEYRDNVGDMDKSCFKIVSDLEKEYVVENSPVDWMVYVMIKTAWINAYLAIHNWRELNICSARYIHIDNEVITENERKREKEAVEEYNKIKKDFSLLQELVENYHIKMAE